MAKRKGKKAEVMATISNLRKEVHKRSNELDAESLRMKQEIGRAKRKVDELVQELKGSQDEVIKVGMLLGLAEDIIGGFNDEEEE